MLELLERGSRDALLDLKNVIGNVLNCGSNIGYTLAIGRF
jgi:hypothetical protein